ncbi:unnamed protein product, partial [Ectocarpus sp. 12 AP-2014]
SEPTNYWSSGYIQTANIDLVDVQSLIKPIGDVDYSSSPFSGTYDGAEFWISNWTYIDPAAAYDSCLKFSGLFGYVRPGVVKNVRMDGVCILDGFKTGGGIVAGGYYDGDNISNIECNFSPGSYVVGTGHTGGVIGFLQSTPTDGITLRGTLDLSRTDTARGGSLAHTTGALIGSIVNNVYSNLRNLATFPGGISGAQAGGVIGYVIRASELTNIVNAMTGDINGTTNSGGIIGRGHASDAISATNMLNAMTGNIAGTDVGGIIGWTSSVLYSMSDVANYMTGDIIGTNSGGMLGKMSTNVKLNNSICAMNGT